MWSPGSYYMNKTFSTCNIILFSLKKFFEGKIEEKQTMVKIWCEPIPVYITPFFVLLNIIKLKTIWML